MGNQSKAVSFQRLVSGLLIRESPPTPGWAVERLTTLGGLNRFGEPNYRLIWSSTRLSWVAGKFEDRDEEGHLIREVLASRVMPKYPVANRWIIEQWLAPEKYGSREAWWRDTREWGEEGNLPQLGPYPERGDYEVACVLETSIEDGKRFVQVEPYLIEEFFWLMKLARIRSYNERVRRRKELQAQEKKRFQEQAHQTLNEETMPVANDGMMVTVL